MQITKSQGLYINGEWRKGHGKEFLSINPATLQIIWQGREASSNDVKEAVQSAHKAAFSWQQCTFATRVEYIEKFIQEVKRKLPLLTETLSQDTGKPLWEAKTELNALENKLKLSSAAFRTRSTGNVQETQGKVERLSFRPLGVALVLGAFNFPIHLSHGHIIPLLLAGNTVVFKPSELTPLIAECIIKCWDNSGLPKGVLNLVEGDANVAKSLLKETFNGIYFTGSYKTGLAIHNTFKDKPEVLLALEMGGNNPLIITAVKDIQAAVYNTILSSFITAGQRCSSARRIILPNTSFADKFLQLLLKACKSLKIGPYTDLPEPFMGPVISEQHAQNHLKSQAQLLKTNAKSLLEMQLCKQQGAFLSPGIIEIYTAKLIDEEIFAPLVQIYRYEDFSQAIKLANQTEYGLTAGLFSDSQDDYVEFASSIKAGVLAFNRPTTGASSALPFGGIGKSGNHRPSAYFAADYCVYPIASLEQDKLEIPENLMPGVVL
ncbi:MAG: succinylglutamate-semialdehyde dehydrogenase [Legionellales bacterium RIFCSPHIGHO2_12_FULL_37_14]|nr:MAG: succinylglutamate-semialdehyde dehydrogenase [Legionellales bacterium RIFCSPHIGHO2_12_FULL_37_14]